MDRTILRLILLVTISLLVGGCVDTGGSDGSDISASSTGKADLVRVGSLDDINRTLASGPVLVEMGYASCPACAAQKPIMEEIAAEYQDRAGVMYIDTREVGAIAFWFGADYVPDSFIIVDVEDGQYVYMRPDGQETTDRASARFVGLTGKGTLTQTLDRAIEARQEEVRPVQVPEKVEMTAVLSFDDINRTLASGPVLVEMGSESCSACAAQKPIMEEIATEYQGKAGVLYVDTRKAGTVAKRFGADYVPDSFIIVDMEDGQYVYMRPDGQETTDRISARFLGLTEKEPIVQTLDQAIEARKEN